MLSSRASGGIGGSGLLGGLVGSGVVSRKIGAILLPDIALSMRGEEGSTLGEPLDDFWSLGVDCLEWCFGVLCCD